MTVPIFKLSNQIEPFYLQYSSHTDGHNSRYVDTTAILRTRGNGRRLVRVVGVIAVVAGVEEGVAVNVRGIRGDLVDGSCLVLPAASR